MQFEAGIRQALECITSHVLHPWNFVETSFFLAGQKAEKGDYPTLSPARSGTKL